MSWIRTAATNVSSATAGFIHRAAEATSAAADSVSRAVTRAVDRVSSAAATAYDDVKRAAAAATRRVVKFFKRLSESKVARRWILRVAVALLIGAVVAAVVYLLTMCFFPTAAASTAAVAVLMVAPGTGGLMILRPLFAALPWLYFFILGAAGPAPAAGLFGGLAVAMPIVLALVLCVIIYFLF
jgi:hypothetical protein